MIEGFYNETKPLSEVEQQQLPIIVQALSRKIGVDRSVTNKQIASGILKNFGVKLADARIRKIINHIRMHDLLPGLIATSSGYYVTGDIEELKTYERSLEGREQAINAIRRKLREYIDKLEDKQLQLF